MTTRKDKTVTIVSGLGRCGSSLVMQMLAGGGMATTGHHPSYEADECLPTAFFDSAWIAMQYSSAVKVLMPHLDIIKFAPSIYRSIWVDRDPVEQARSTKKFMKILCGVDLNRNAIKTMAKSYPNERKASLKKLKTLGPVLEISFETILQYPVCATADLCNFTGLTMCSSMRAVIRDRSPKARPDMALELSLMPPKVLQQPTSSASETSARQEGGKVNG